MKLPLIALALSAFGIGTTEFVIMGLLPNVANDLHVSIPLAGMLITGYALGVAIGAPVMTLALVKVPRKLALLLLMAIFIVGNVLCALSPNYTTLMVARVITALCHGAFFGVGSVAAASLVPESKKASAVSMMFAGLTIANVIGVPFGTWLGQEAGWRMTFWAVAVIGIFALLALALFLPKSEREDSRPDMIGELRALRSWPVWIALAMSALFSASMFALFTYIAPILNNVTHISPHGVSITLLLIGAGSTIGNIIGGKLSDKNLSATIIGLAALIAVLQFVFYWGDRGVVPAETILFLWGALSFAAVSALQVNAMACGDKAPDLIATLNIGAFNLGNAAGAATGGLVIGLRFGVVAVPAAASLLAVAGLLVSYMFFHGNKKLLVRRSNS